MRENYNIHARPRPDSWLDSVAHFVVIMNDVMNDNMAALAPVGARLGVLNCVLLLDQIF